VTTTDLVRLNYRVTEAAKETGVSQTLLYEAIKAGELDYFKVGRSRLIHGDALRAYIDRLRVTVS
jgi:excisionase family DNA binding protein